MVYRDFILLESANLVSFCFCEIHSNWIRHLKEGGVDLAHGPEIGNVAPITYAKARKASFEKALRAFLMNSSICVQPELPTLKKTACFPIIGSVPAMHG